MRAVFAIALPAIALAADPITLVMPQSLYQPVGATTALRSGASAAMGDEAAATWYDPAIAADLDPEQLSAGATAYGFNSINVQADQDSNNKLSGAVLKVYGGLSGRADDGRLGWAVMFANPLHWTGAVDAGRSEAIPGQRSYASHVRVDQDTWSAQAAVGSHLNDRVQVGFALVGNYDSIDLDQSLWMRDHQGRYAASEFVTTAWSASLQARFGLRLAADATRGPVFACAVTTPAIEVLHGGIASLSTLQSDPAAGTALSTDARTEGDAFRFVHPWQFIAAAGWREPGWDAELDLVWSLPKAEHETTPELEGYTLETSGGVTTATDLLLPPRYTGYRNVLNARAGCSVKVSDRILLHGGAFTDFSPIASSDIYNTIDFYGLSGGISIRRGNGAIVLGVSTSWGSREIGLYDPASNTVIGGQVEVLSMDLLIGTVAKF